MKENAFTGKTLMSYRLIGFRSFFFLFERRKLPPGQIGD